MLRENELFDVIGDDRVAPYQCRESNKSQETDTSFMDRTIQG